MFQSDDADAAIVFPFPLFTTCVHMIVQFSLASLVLFLLPQYRPRHDSFNPHQPRPIQTEPIDPKKPLMTRAFYLTRIGPCGAATGLDIGLGNMSLKFISMTFYSEFNYLGLVFGEKLTRFKAMCKSSVLGFVLVFAFIFRLEKPSWKLMGIITTMTAGVLLMVAGETAFDPLGFILVMTAAASSGFRWSLTQILLIRNPATSNPFATVFFLAPVMFITLLIIAVPVEGIGPLSEAWTNLANQRGSFTSAGILLFPGCLAFMMTASEFALLQRTSVVTLSICGIFKEVLTISTATIVFKDKLTPINVSGLVVTIATIAVYNYMKIKKMREDAQMEAHLIVEQEYAPVLSTEPEERSGNHRSGRGSTSDLIRNSLSISTAGSQIRPQTESPSRPSPVKRPEDLE
jgi:solute carrier family 35 protein C2